MIRSRQGWKCSHLIGTAICVQLFNLLLWKISREAILCPTLPPSVCPVCVPSSIPSAAQEKPVECPVVSCDSLHCTSSAPIATASQRQEGSESLIMDASVLSQKFPSEVMKLKLEQAPFAYTKFWSEMHDMVRKRHGIDSLRSDHYEETLRLALTEREGILEEYYKSRSEVIPTIQKTVESIKKDNAIILMAFNYGSIVLFYNWVCSCKKANISISNLLVISADEKTHMLLSSMNVSSLYLPKFFGNYQSEGVKAFGTLEWNPFGRLKILVPKLILELGVNILFQDVDLIWFKDPFLLFREKGYSDYDFVIQHVGRNRPMFGPFYGNSGLFFMKGNAHVQACWDRVFFDLDKIHSWSGSQQMVLNYHLGLCAAPDSPMALRVRYVDPMIFPSGWVAQNGTMKKALIERNELFQEFVLYHTNWAVNVEEKIRADVNYQIWYLSSKVNEQTDPQSLGADFCVP